MQVITTIGLDIAKSEFAVGKSATHGFQSARWSSPSLVRDILPMFQA